LPLESTSIYLIQIAITTLIDYLADARQFDPRIVDAYNRWIEMEYDRVRDFLILHYHATERDDAPLWDYCRTMDVPDSLKHKMELFRERARVVTYKDGLFLEPSWLAVYFGQRVMPRGYDSLADAANGDDLARQMQAVREQIHNAVVRMPGHEDFLQRYCPSGTPAARSGT
jgi:tryptophan halogenase